MLPCANGVKLKNFYFIREKNLMKYYFQINKTYWQSIIQEIANILTKFKETEILEQTRKTLEFVLVTSHLGKGGLKFPSVVKCFVQLINTVEDTCITFTCEHLKRKDDCTENHSCEDFHRMEPLVYKIYQHLTIHNKGLFAKVQFKHGKNFISLQRRKFDQQLSTISPSENYQHKFLVRPYGEHSVHSVHSEHKERVDIRSMIVHTKMLENVQREFDSLIAGKDFVYLFLHNYEKLLRETPYKDLSYIPKLLDFFEENTVHEEYLFKLYDILDYILSCKEMREYVRVYIYTSSFTRLFQKDHFLMKQTLKKMCKDIQGKCEVKG
jgi:hypothetical protein